MRNNDLPRGEAQRASESQYSMTGEPVERRKP